MDAERRERISGAVQRLRDEREQNGGRLPLGLMGDVVKLVGVPPSTLYRYMERGAPGPRSGKRWSWGDAERAALQVAGGDVTYARMLLERDGDYDADLPSVRWMQALVHRDVAPDQQALYSRGVTAARQRQLVTTVEVSRRNELWLIDHFKFDCPANPERGKPGRPWATVVMDAYSRKILGAAVSFRPNQAHVLAALHMAIAAAGVPRTLQFDRGLEFTADAIVQAANDLVFAAVPARARHPEHRGKLERLIKTINILTVREFPQRTTAAVTRAKTPLLWLEGDPAAPPLAALIDVFFDQVANYNDTVHRTLAATPNEVYATDPTPERTVPAEDLRRFLLKERRRGIREHGVQFKGEWYDAPELDGFRGKKQVEIRYRQDDLTRLEVFDFDGSWLCTARIRDAASPANRDRVIASRGARLRQHAKDTRRARRLAKRNYAAIVGPGRVRETTVVTGAEVDQELRGASGRMAAAVKHLGLDRDGE